MCKYIDQAGLEFIEIHLPLLPEFWIKDWLFKKQCLFLYGRVLLPACNMWAIYVLRAQETRKGAQILGNCSYGYL